MAGTDKIFGKAWLGPAIALVMGSLLVGCGPKRVVRTEAPVEVVQTVPAEAPRDALPETPAKPPIQQPQPTGSRLGLEAASLARAQLGKPYQWGASGPEKFDCSGLVMYVYDNLGVPLPRVTREQAYAGVHIDMKDLQQGDLVFFKLNGSGIDHVGIYVGRNEFIHAPRKYMPVRIDSLNDSYWRRRFKGGRRVG